MTATPIILTGSFLNPEGLPAAGSVVASLTEAIANGGQSIGQLVRFAYLDENGNLALAVVSNLDAGTSPAGSQWYCTVDLVGSPRTAGYVSVPAAPVGSRSVTDAVTMQNSVVLTSATASFVSGDVGKYVACEGIIPLTTIAAINSSTSVNLSLPATASGTGLTLLIGAQADLFTLLGV